MTVLIWWRNTGPNHYRIQRKKNLVSKLHGSRSLCEPSIMHLDQYGKIVSQKTTSYELLFNIEQRFKTKAYENKKTVIIEGIMIQICIISLLSSKQKEIINWYNHHSPLLFGIQNQIITSWMIPTNDTFLILQRNSQKETEDRFKGFEVIWGSRRYAFRVGTGCYIWAAQSHSYLEHKSVFQVMYQKDLQELPILSSLCYPHHWAMWMEVCISLQKPAIFNNVNLLISASFEV